MSDATDERYCYRCTGTEASTGSPLYVFGGPGALAVCVACRERVVSEKRAARARIDATGAIDLNSRARRPKRAALLRDLYYAAGHAGCGVKNDVISFEDEARLRRLRAPRIT